LEGKVMGHTYLVFRNGEILYQATGGFARTETESQQLMSINFIDDTSVAPHLIQWTIKVSLSSE